MNILSFLFLSLELVFHFEKEQKRRDDKKERQGRRREEVQASGSATH